MTSSFDKMSVTSSGKLNSNQNDEDVFEDGTHMKRAPKGPPPKVLPKPSLSRFLSSESNPSVLHLSGGIRIIPEQKTKLLPIIYS